MTLPVVRHRSALREILAPHRTAGRSIGLVPTMGALHEGHLSLLRAARRRCDVVIMSLFVNPLQFGPSEDLSAYPRDESRDVDLAESAGADLVYAPTVEEVYPDGFATSVTVDGLLTSVLCGSPASRGPSHFAGVTTLVAKLFNAVGPDVAFFGQKDAQQALVIRRMAHDLELPVEIETCPIVREPDGLAMSSRNVYLSPAERAQAQSLYRALTAAAEAPSLDSGLTEARKILADAGVVPEYLEARDAQTLAPVDDVRLHAAAGDVDPPVLIAVAAAVGRARLIDNVVVGS